MAEGLGWRTGLCHLVLRDLVRLGCTLSCQQRRHVRHLGERDVRHGVVDYHDLLLESGSHHSAKAAICGVHVIPISSGSYTFGATDASDGLVVSLRANQASCQLLSQDSAAQLAGGLAKDAVVPVGLFKVVRGVPELSLPI